MQSGSVVCEWTFRLDLHIHSVFLASISSCTVSRNVFSSHISSDSNNALQKVVPQGNLALYMAHAGVEKKRGVAGKSARPIARRMVVLSGYRDYVVRGVSIGSVNGICLGYSNLNC